MISRHHRSLSSRWDRVMPTLTGSTWAPTGTAVAGSLAGQQLAAVPHYNKIFWYVWSDFNPGTPIHAANSAATAD